MQSGNPIFRRMERQNENNSKVINADGATYKGIMFKTLGLFLLTVASAVTTMLLSNVLANILGLLVIVGSIVAFIAVMVGSFSPRLSRSTSIIYAISQGLVLGVVSMLFDAIVENVVISALVGTASIFLVMLILHMTGVVKATTRLRNIVLGSLIALMVSSLILSVIGLVAQSSFDSFGLQVGISAIMIVIGAIMLVLDFGRAAAIVEYQMPKTYEWQAALGFMITVIWIYIELLRLLAILAMHAKD